MIISQRLDLRPEARRCCRRGVIPVDRSFPGARRLGAGGKRSAPSLEEELCPGWVGAASSEAGCVGRMLTPAALDGAVGEVELIGVVACSPTRTVTRSASSGIEGAQM